MIKLHLSLDGTPGMKDVLSLAFLLETLLGIQNPLEDKHFPHIRYQKPWLLPLPLPFPQPAPRQSDQSPQSP